ncbi:adenylate isopentenyltransferase 5, chloroplastic-like [Curcuma longa]|uniref:adenylate isopentenyltransferase 5, chloroplastic-like n=1 Tax=Curcuma longa TaxID=136217 RepID=UPI003D9E5EC3
MAKAKVVFVMGATGTGKSRLAIDLALRFGGEVVNSDKMQIYDGLHVITNKVTDEERQGVPHHLLGGLPPDADFTAGDFRDEATRAVESVTLRRRLPVVAGGSNSFIEELVEGADREFLRRFECCFLWVDVRPPVLHRFLGERVDRMVASGLVDEVRALFDPDVVADYSRGVRRAIGVVEMDRFLRAEAENAEEAVKAALMEAAIDEIKANTCKLTCCQLQKINRLCGSFGRRVRKVDATDVFVKSRAEADAAWEELVVGPSVDFVADFLQREESPEAEKQQSGVTLTNESVA